MGICSCNINPKNLRNKKSFEEISLKLSTNNS